MNESFLSIATRGSVVRRALCFALVVGPLLILINHWDTLFEGRLGLAVWIKMALTLLVPYLVSTFSSVSAYREHRSDDPEPGSDNLAKGR